MNFSMVTTCISWLFFVCIYNNTNIFFSLPGAVPVFISLLESPTDDVKEQAVWALGNIAGDSTELRNLVLENNVLPPLLRLFGEQTTVSMLRNATWTLSNLCRGKKPPPDFNRIRHALPVLARLIYSRDDEVLTDACWALSYVSDGDNTKIGAVIDAGVCRRLVELLMHTMPSVVTPALRTVGNIVTGDDMQTQVVLNCSVLPCLLHLLSYNKETVRKEACWTISNITAGHRDQIQAVIEAGLIPPLVEILSTADFKTRKEAAWAISNATSGGIPDQIEYIVSQGCILPLCDLLAVSDPKIVEVALEALENILRSGDNVSRPMGTPNPYVQVSNLVVVDVLVVGVIVVVVIVVVVVIGFYILSKVCSFVPQQVEEVGGIERIEGLQHHDNEV